MKTGANIDRRGFMAAGAVVLCGMSVLAGAEAAEAEKWVALEQDGRIEARHADKLRFAWQNRPLTSPKGGAKFAGSAFMHSLRTPSGFEWTTIQPDDHLHHFGLWWPWKLIEVNGKSHNCWEIQEGQGALVAKSVKPLAGGPDKLEWEFLNAVEIRTADAPPLTVIDETARVSLTNDGADAMVLDLDLRQKATGGPVKILNYRYSGFSWRGPSSWNKDNSVMTTSEGKGRDAANGTAARWVVVSGPTPTGSASVLMMSAAIEVAGTPEQLRVWDSKTHGGAPFVNFNPVSKVELPLDDAHPAVSRRKYRVVAADRVIDAVAAEAAWRKWLEK